MSDTSSDLSARELFVLGVVSRQAIHGHGINRILEVSEADRWVDISEKHVYYVLRKLERAGLVTSVEDRAGAGPPRNIYRITRAGRTALRSALTGAGTVSATTTSPFDTAFAILAYSDVVDEKETTSILHARRTALVAALSDHRPSARLVLEETYGKAAAAMFEKTRVLLEAELAWLDGVIADVDRQGWQSFRVPAFDPAGGAE